MNQLVMSFLILYYDLSLLKSKVEVTRIRFFKLLKEVPIFTRQQGEGQGTIFLKKIWNFYGYQYNRIENPSPRFPFIVEGICKTSVVLVRSGIKRRFKRPHYWLHREVNAPSGRSRCLQVNKILIYKGLWQIAVTISKVMPCNWLSLLLGIRGLTNPESFVV